MRCCGRSSRACRRARSAPGSGTAWRTTSRSTPRVPSTSASTRRSSRARQISPARRRRCTSRATSSGCVSISARPTRCPSSATTSDRFGLGCAPLGGLYEEVPEDEARATIDRAWEAGVRFFDTAPLYGSGLSERRLGAALRGRPRDEHVLSTKVGRLLSPGEPSPLFPGAPPVAALFDFSADGARPSLAESLERLGRDRVDIVLIHDPDDHLGQALAEAYPALEELRSQGVVRRIGV